MTTKRNEFTSMRKEIKEARKTINLMAGCHYVEMLEAIEHLCLTPGEAMEVNELIKSVAREEEE